MTEGGVTYSVLTRFNQHRSKYSLLLAHALPSVGGDTGFCDVRRAYNDLPESQKKYLSDFVVEHKSVKEVLVLARAHLHLLRSLWHSRKIAAPEEFSSVTEHEMAAKPPAFHKLVQKAPDGRETMFIAAHAKRIVGLPDDEGLKIITDLIDHCTQAEVRLQ